MKIGIQINTIETSASAPLTLEQINIIKKLKADGHKIAIVLNMKQFEGELEFLNQTSKYIEEVITDFLTENDVPFDEIVTTNDSQRDICVNNGINYLVKDQLAEETYESISKMTGYASIDRPWLQYYSEEQKHFSVPGKLIYSYMKESNLGELNGIALNYFGKKITYKELLVQIDLCAKAFLAQDVKDGDIVSVCMPTTPESIIILYALNKIGAVSSFIDPRKTSDQIAHCVEDSKSKILITLDTVYPKLQKTANTKIIGISALESFGQIPQAFLNPKNHYISKRRIANGEYMSWNDFILKGNHVKNEYTAKYYKDRLAIIEYTSGTTAEPKGVELSNDTINARVQQYKNNGMIYHRNDVYTDIIPIFLAFGVVVGIHLPLSMGMQDFLVPAFDERKTIALMKKSNPQHLTFTPSSFVRIAQNSKISQIDFSNKITLGCGGDGMSSALNIIINDTFEKYGCKYKLCNGYGGTEVGAPFCTENHKANKSGSVGIPLPKSKVIILNPFTHEELQYNQIGEICMVDDYPMIGYRNRPDLTEKVKIKLANGKTGIILGDYGYMDENGFLFVKGRKEYAIHLLSGCVIWPVDIENILINSNLLYNCGVVQSGSAMATAFIVKKDNCNLDDESLKQKLYESILKSEIPSECFIDIVLLKSLPLTGSGKIDRSKLTEMALSEAHLILKKAF